MAENEEPTSESPESTQQSENNKGKKGRELLLDPEIYDRLIDRLKDERYQLERDMKHEYRNARRYVRAHPEEGIGIAVLGGVMLGFLLGRISRD